MLTAASLIQIAALCRGDPYGRPRAVTRAALTKTSFPQGKGFLDRVFFALKPSAPNSLMDERFLVERESYFPRFHGPKSLVHGKVY